MFTGTIKRIMDKGFGFIAVPGSPDVFFHMSACGGQFDALRQGQHVRFDVEDSPRGKKARNVAVVAEYAPVSL